MTGWVTIIQTSEGLKEKKKKKKWLSPEQDGFLPADWNFCLDLQPACLLSGFWIAKLPKSLEPVPQTQPLCLYVSVSLCPSLSKLYNF